MTDAEHLKSIRKALHLTQEEMAEKVELTDKEYEEWVTSINNEMEKVKKDYRRMAAQSIKDAKDTIIY